MNVGTSRRNDSDAGIERYLEHVQPFLDRYRRASDWVLSFLAAREVSQRRAEILSAAKREGFHARTMDTVLRDLVRGRKILRLGRGRYQTCNPRL